MNTQSRSLLKKFKNLYYISRDIHVPEHRKRSEKVHFGEIDILASTPPADVKLAPKCLFSGALQYNIEFYLRGGTDKNLKIKIYPPCFEKVFFRKISLRGLQWYILSYVYPLWCWKNKHLKIF